MTQPQPSPQNEPTVTDAAADGIAAAIGRIPSGLFVVTWRAKEQPEDSAATDRGMLASWIMQGGFAPPLITIAVDTSRDLLTAIDQCSPFVVNVLGESQRPLVSRFGRPASPGDNLFDGLRIEHTATGNAVFADAVAWLECQAVSQTGGGGDQTGDHVIILARVLAAGTGPEQQPLVHVRKNGLRY